MNRITRSELEKDLAAKGLRLNLIGTTWYRGYVSRRQSSADNAFFPSSRRGSSMSRCADYFCLVPARGSTQFCYREWYRVVPLDGSSREAAL